MDEWLAETSVIPEILNGRECCYVTGSGCCSKLRYKHASFGNMLWVECGFYFTSDENFLIMVQLMDLVARRGRYVEGVGTWICEDRIHSFVRLLAAHKANGNDVALITPTIEFPRTWKKWVLYLSPSGEHNSVMHDNGDANTVSIESWRVTPSFYLRFRIWICVFAK